MHICGDGAAAVQLLKPGPSKASLARDHAPEVRAGLGRRSARATCTARGAQQQQQETAPLCASCDGARARCVSPACSSPAPRTARTHRAARPQASSDSQRDEQERSSFGDGGGADGDEPCSKLPAAWSGGERAAAPPPGSSDPTLSGSARGQHNGSASADQQQQQQMCTPLGKRKMSTRQSQRSPAQQEGWLHGAPPFALALRLRGHCSVWTGGT